MKQGYKTIRCCNQTIKWYQLNALYGNITLNYKQVDVYTDTYPHKLCKLRCIHDRDLIGKNIHRYFIVSKIELFKRQQLLLYYIMIMIWYLVQFKEAILGSCKFKDIHPLCIGINQGIIHGRGWLQPSRFHHLQALN